MDFAISIYTIHDIYLFYKIPSVKYVFALCKLSGNLEGSSSDKCDGLLRPLNYSKWTERPLVKLY